MTTSSYSTNLDEEWFLFNGTDISSNTDTDQSHSFKKSYVKNHDNALNHKNDDYEDLEISDEQKSLIPVASDIHISTKSKIAYLNQEIDIKQTFWLIPTIPYYLPNNGVIKKQIKFNSDTQEELDAIQDKLLNETYFQQHVLISINNPDGRIKFKDTRKITIGMSKKDIVTYRTKIKSAFYNCFVMIVRLKCDDVFKEFHVKIFNTGKLEIPGIQNERSYLLILQYIIEILQPILNKPMQYKQTSDTVLINSNFNCGFYIDREILYDILRYKYNIQCIYDPCSYPGIQCRFYYDPDLIKQTGNKITKENLFSKNMLYKKKEKKDKKDKSCKIVEVSFMIFRTGSILIVGMCNDDVLYIIYEFIKNLLQNEYHQINQKSIRIRDVKNKIKKIKKKTIFTTTSNENFTLDATTST
jgi:TATA-box binding protein (TBP) (component of TFIID and TFIIIB)